MSAIGGCEVFQQFHSLLRATTTMPAQRSSSTCATSIGGSFVEGSSSHNQHRFSSARDDLSRPYLNHPTATFIIAPIHTILTKTSSLTSGSATSSWPIVGSPD